MRIACWDTKGYKHTLTICNTYWFFSCNRNASQCRVIRTLTVLLYVWEYTASRLRRCQHACKRESTSHWLSSYNIHSFRWHVQNATIPCPSQELLPFFSIMYFFLPPFSTNYSSILSHLIFPSLTSSFHLFLGLPLNLVVSKFIYNTLLGNSIFFHSLYMPKPM